MEVEDTPDPNHRADVVRIDVLSRNGKNFDHKFLTKDIRDLWEKALKHDPKEVIGQSSSKISSKVLRINIELNREISFEEVSPTPDFTYEISSVFGNCTYECKVVGVGRVDEAEIGDTVVVTIRRVHFRFKAEQATEWMSKFGKIISPPRCVKFVLSPPPCMLVPILVKDFSWPLACPLFTSLAVSCRDLNGFSWTIAVSLFSSCVFVVITDLVIFPLAVPDRLITPPGTILNFTLPLHSIFVNSSNVKDTEGVNTEAISLKIQLAEHIPEWLPMFSCKARIYYHGMKIQCNSCWKLGHFSQKCHNEKITWKDFVIQLSATGNFPDHLFGRWLEKKEEKTSEDPAQQLQALMSSNADLRRVVELLKAGNKEDTSKPKKGRPKNAGAKKPRKAN